MGKIKLRKVREFGEIISDTFNFIGKNFSQLVKIFIFFVAPVALISSAISGYAQNQMVSSMQSVTQMLEQDPGAISLEMFSGFFNGYYFISLFLSLFTYGIIGYVLYTYMKLYEESKSGVVELDSLREGLVGKTLLMTLFLLMCYTIYFFGLMLFIIPGVFLMIASSLLLVVHINENTGFIDSFKRSMSLISGYWWFTFSLFLVVLIILSFVVGFIQLIISLAFGLGTSLLEQEPSTALSIVTAIITFLGYFFNFIMWIMVGILYYSLVEIKEGKNVFEKIDKIGDTHTREEIDRMFR